MNKNHTTPSATSKQTQPSQSHQPPHIPNEIWLEIKSYLFHDIRTQGKHLKKEIPIINYNKVVRTIPKPKIMTTGPCIVYVSNKKFPLVKFIYHLRHKTWQRQKRIIEYMPFPKTYKRYYKMYDELYRVEYYNQYLTP